MRLFLKHTKKLALALNKLISYVLISLIIGIRPLLGPAVCYFSPSCTSFAQEQLQKKAVPYALYAIICRLLVCSPFYKIWLIFKK